MKSMAAKTESRIISSLGLTGANDITVTSEALNNYKLSESNDSDVLTIENGDFNFVKLDDGTYKLTGRGTIPPEASHIIIPSMYKGSAVTEIGASAFYQDENLEKVTIPITIKYIGVEAFFGSSVKTIEFQEVDDVIIFFKRPTDTWGTPYVKLTFTSPFGEEMDNGDGAAMDLVDPVEHIYSCPILSSATKIVFCSEDKTEDTVPYIIDADTAINNHLFKTQTRVANGGKVYYTLRPIEFYRPDPETSYYPLTIEERAFANCDGITNVFLPLRLRKLKTGVFEQCEGLRYVNLPDYHGLYEISSSCFKGCGRLVEAYFGHGLKEIGNSAFENCGELEYFDLQVGVERIGTNAFKNCEKCMEVLIPTSVKRIAPGAFHLDNYANLHYNGSKRYILFENPYTWVMNDTIYIDNNGTNVEVWEPTDLIATQWGTATSLRNSARLSTENSDKYWHRIEQMLPPQISTSEGKLHMTDPLGVAEKFYIYVNGDKSARITIDLTTTGS